MKKVLLICLVLTLTFGLSGLALAGNGAPNGAHFNLNIIGVVKGKTEPMTNTDRHTIFVALGSNNADVKSNIYLVPGASFAVCDGNAFDAAYDCSGNLLTGSQGAVFQLPCNTNLPTNPTLVACSATYPSASYTVWARELGQPNNQAIITTCATDTNTQEVVCSLESTLNVLYRSKGKQNYQNVTNLLTSLVWNNGTQTVRQALFTDPLVNWFWQYDNYGCKLTQLRLYVNP